jgi:hypothetical protein
MPLARRTNTRLESNLQRWWMETARKTDQTGSNQGQRCERCTALLRYPGIELARRAGPQASCVNQLDRVVIMGDKTSTLKDIGRTVWFIAKKDRNHVDDHDCHNW